MKKYIIIILLFSYGDSFSQSFQWAKRGGGNYPISNTQTHRPEEPIRIVTDANNNSYTISRVTGTSLDVDGNVRPYYDQGLEFDYVLASFACDGTYRWSKTIWGAGFEVLSLATDGQGNVFVGGKFGNCQSGFYPPQIEGDIVIPQMPTADCSLIFLAKFNTNGVMQWFKRPQSTTVSAAVGFSQTGSRGITVDSLGNSYWLVTAPPGTYADGAFTNAESTARNYIFKYDTNGNFVSATLMDFSVTLTFGQNLRYYRNPQTGHYYLTSNKLNTSTPTAILGGTTVTGSFFIACFDTNGQKLWHQEDTSGATGGFMSYDLVTDTSNNVYFAGKINGSDAPAVFMGVSSPTPIQKSYIIKLNPTGSAVLWSTVSLGIGVYESAGLAINGSEIGLVSSCFGPDYVWGSQSMFVSNLNQGTEILFARFNKETGACIALNKIPGNVGYEDNGSALAVDSSGDYIIGGGFGNTLYVNGTTTLSNSGSQTDFFIAKYALNTCSLSTDQPILEQGINIYPNPVKDLLTVAVHEDSTFEIYTVLGKLIKQGKVSQNNNTIDCSSLPSGYYLLYLSNNSGTKQITKLVKLHK